LVVRLRSWDAERRDCGRLAALRNGERRFHEPIERVQTGAVTDDERGRDAVARSVRER
jgi:hypothetical protein